MKKSLMLSIMKNGMSTYVNTPVPKVSSMKRMLSRWEESKTLPINDNVRTIIQDATTKKEKPSPEQMELLKNFFMTGKQRDCIHLMKQCINYYIRRHRFKFSPEVHDVLSKPIDEVDYDVCESIFTGTIGEFEAKHKFFEKTLQNKRNTNGGNNTTMTVKIGPFNRYVKDQWNQRRDELRQVCLNGKSTDVMKLLSSEWNADVSIRRQYTTVPPSVNNNN